MTPGGGVALRLTETPTGLVAGYAGLATCGSVWADPVCAAKVLARRAFELGAAFTVAEAMGYRLGFGTLTMRHERRQPLELLWNAGRKGWRRATSGNVWHKHMAKHGVVGWVRVWEVTDGRNGWHVHVHFVVVLQEGATSADMESIGRGMFGRWSKGVQALGLAAPLLAGQDWHLVEGDSTELADYLAKLGRSGGESMGLELTHVQPGRARSTLGTQPVWSLIEGMRNGEAVAIRRWHEWEAGSKGRRMIGWSKGLRDLLSAGTEQTDEEVAAQELGSSSDDLVLITDWGPMRRQPHRIALLQEVAEALGLSGVREVLDGWGDVPYEIA